MTSNSRQNPGSSQAKLAENRLAENNTANPYGQVVPFTPWSLEPQALSSAGFGSVSRIIAVLATTAVSAILPAGLSAAGASGASSAALRQPAPEAPSGAEPSGAEIPRGSRIGATPVKRVIDGDDSLDRRRDLARVEKLLHQTLVLLATENRIFAATTCFLEAGAIALELRQEFPGHLVEKLFQTGEGVLRGLNDLRAPVVPQQRNSYNIPELDARVKAVASLLELVARVHGQNVAKLQAA